MPIFYVCLTCRTLQLGLRPLAVAAREQLMPVVAHVTAHVVLQGGSDAHPRCPHMQWWHVGFYLRKVLEVHVLMLVGVLCVRSLGWGVTLPRMPIICGTV